MLVLSEHGCKMKDKRLLKSRKIKQNETEIGNAFAAHWPNIQCFSPSQFHSSNIPDLFMHVIFLKYLMTTDSTTLFSVLCGFFNRQRAIY